MSSESTLVLRVLRTPDGSGLAVGTMLPVRGRTAVVGRSPEADVVVDDATVSRRHLRIEPGPPVVVETLTSSNGTFLDEVRLTPGTRVTVQGDAAQIQLGGVLVAVVPLAETEPVLDLVSADERHPGHATATDPPEERAKPLLSVRWDAGQCAVWCEGRDLGLTGAPARFLGLLAERAGVIVHRWDLEEALDTVHLAPLATTVRNALQRALDTGVLNEQRLRQCLRAAAVDVEGLGQAELVRAVLRSRRRHGYVLQLPAGDVEVHQE